MDAQPKAPLAIVGVVWQSQTGGIPQAGRFPHRFVLSRSTSCESLSHGYGVPAPFGKGASGVQRRSPPGHCGGASAPPRRGDSTGKACGTSYLFPLHYSLKTFPFPHGFVLWWSANCESLSHASGVPAPFGKGASGVPPVSISHGSFLRIVLSLTRPVSLLRCSRCLGQSPPCQRGVPRQRRGGGIPQAGKFPHRLVLLESACCGIPQSRLRRASSLWQGSLWAHYRYRAGQGSDDTQKAIVRIDSGGTPPLAREPFLCLPGGGENKCFTNKYRDNPYYIQKIRGNSNLSVIFTGGVVKTTKIGIEIMAMFVYNYLIVVQGT